MNKALAIFGVVLLCGGYCLYQQAPQPVALRFALALDGNPLVCGVPVDWNGAPLELTDLRMFVHEIELIDAAGKATPLRLQTEGRWQTDGVALLDFEGGAASHGSSALRTEVLGHAAAGEYVGVRFRLGVPFDANHADPARATGPLTGTAMHWGWRGGYKFVRLDARYGAAGRLRLHLGSTGCEGSFANITDCARSNRAQLELPLTGDRVVFDLAPLLADLSTDADVVCMSDPDDADCEAMFVALGLDLQSGLALAGVAR